MAKSDKNSSKEKPVKSGRQAKPASGSKGTRSDKTIKGDKSPIYVDTDEGDG